MNCDKLAKLDSQHTFPPPFFSSPPLLLLFSPLTLHLPDAFSFQVSPTILLFELTSVIRPLHHRHRKEQLHGDWLLPSSHPGTHSCSTKINQQIKTNRRRISSHLTIAEKCETRKVCVPSSHKSDRCFPGISHALRASQPRRKRPFKDEDKRRR